MELKEKIVLKEKQTIEVPLDDLIATLKWKKAVDLDLWCFIKFKNGRKDAIGFNNRGGLGSFPNVQLDHDAGVGDQGGDNEENIRFKTLDHIEHAFICANIYGKSNANFSSYDGAVIVKSNTKEFTVPLTSNRGGSWCVIAHFENTNGPVLENVNVTLTDRPKIDHLVSKQYLSIQSTQPKKTGFLGRLFGG